MKQISNLFFYSSFVASFLVDTPDPYVKLFIPSSPNSRRKTKVQSNTRDPIWDEVFYFYLDPEKLNLLGKWHKKPANAASYCSIEK